MARCGGARWVGLLAALLVAVLAACSTIEVFTSFSQVLSDEGFTNPAVNVEGTSPVTLTVSAGSPGGTTSEEAQAQAAELVWTRFPRQIDRVKITIDGTTTTSTAAQLEDRFGPRPEGLDDVALDEELNRFATRALLGMAATAIVLVFGVGIVILLVLRARRVSGRSGRPTPPFAPGLPPPWAPPPSEGPPSTPLTGPTPPPAPSWNDPPTDALPRPTSTPTPRPARTATVGRRPRGPVPPPEQTPPGWGR